MKLLQCFTVCAFLGTLFSLPSRSDEIHFLNKPCRILDTRNTSVGVVPAYTTLNFNLRFSTSNSLAQGGESGCSIPDVSTGAIVNLVAVNTSSTSGWVYMWAADTSVPIASALNINSGYASNDGQAVRLAVFNSASEVSIKPAETSAYFVVDIVAWVGAADNTMEKGVVVDKQGATIPPTVTFDIEAARELLCAEPWIDPELCDQYDVGDCIAVTGHISPDYSFNKMYVHTITGCD